MHFDFNNNNIALIHKGDSYSYSDLGKKIQEFRDELSEKIKRGETVVLLGDYSFDNIALFFSLHLIGIIIVPVTNTNKSEISKKLQIAGARHTIKIKEGKIDIHTDNDRKKNEHAYIKILKDSNHSGLVLFSSGSSGEPKAMVHDLNNLMDNYKNKREKKLVFLLFLLFDHIGGINTLFNILSMKASMVIPENRNPLHIAELIEKYQINVLPSTPTFLNLLLISGAPTKCDLSSLKLITYGTEPMPGELLGKIKTSIPNARLIQTFGTSETGIVRTSSQLSEHLLMKFDNSDQEYKIVDCELWLRSKTRILGYLNYDNSSFTEDGWFKTGDIVEAHEGGYIKIIGRKSDIINVGGEKVFPAEIESALMKLPEIMNCLVFGQENPITGQMVVADIVLRNKTDEDIAEVKGRIKVELSKTLDKYKIPRRIHVVDNLMFTERFKKKRI